MRPEAQAALLREGPEAWNAWRDAAPEVPIDLAGQDLRGIPMRGVDLRRADLRGAQLEHCSFHGAEARDADFRGALFERDVFFSRCGLQGARFEGTGLQEVHFDDCRMFGARLAGAVAYKARFRRCDLRELRCKDGDLRANLAHASFEGSDLSDSNLSELLLTECDFQGGTLLRTHLRESDLRMANFADAKAGGSWFGGAWLEDAHFERAQLEGSYFDGAHLQGAHFTGAHLDHASLERANLSGAHFEGASMVGVNLQRAVLVKTDLHGARLQSALVYGIAAWDVQTDSDPDARRDLVITPPGASRVVVDDIAVAQFVYLLLFNPNIRRVLDTVTRRAVLLLGSFAQDRKDVLETLRDELRSQGFVPILFDFEGVLTRDLEETVLLLAGLCRFVICDLTQPTSVPQELHAIVPQFKVPVATIIARGHEPYALFSSLYGKFGADQAGGHLLKPVRYASTPALLKALPARIIGPATRLADRIEARRRKLGAGRASG